MKLKYYLRGAGIGVVVTTLVLTIAFAFFRPTMSDEDVIARAKQLGMTEQEEDGQETEDIKQTDPEKNSAAAQEGQTGDGEEEQPVEKVAVTIQRGENSAAISQRLQDLGLVDSAAAFDMFLSDQGFDNELRVGTHEIPKDSTFLEIAELLTTKQEETQEEP